MGLRLFGRSYSSYETDRSYKPNKLGNVFRPDPNPDPSNFKVLRFEHVDHHLVVEILYPNCTTYEGRKILVYRNCTLENLLSQKTIDPHFSNNPKFYSPFMRIEPTEYGWQMALKFTKNIL